MAKNIHNLFKSEQKTLFTAVLLGSIRIVNNYPISKNKEMLEKLMSITYNSLVFDHHLNYQVINKLLTKYEEDNLLFYTNSLIEFIPLTFDTLVKDNKDQKIMNFLIKTFFDKLLAIPAINPDKCIDILYCLSYEYRQAIKESNVILNNIGLMTYKAKKKIIAETWKDLHNDFEFMYNVLADNDYIFVKIREIFFDLLEYLHEMFSA